MYENKKAPQSVAIKIMLGDDKDSRSQPEAGNEINDMVGRPGRGSFADAGDKIGNARQ